VSPYSPEEGVDASVGVAGAVGVSVQNAEEAIPPKTRETKGTTLTKATNYTSVDEGMGTNLPLVLPGVKTKYGRTKAPPGKKAKTRLATKPRAASGANTNVAMANRADLLVVTSLVVTAKYLNSLIPDYDEGFISWLKACCNQHLKTPKNWEKAIHWYQQSLGRISMTTFKFVGSNLGIIMYPYLQFIGKAIGACSKKEKTVG
jgi:hypothetical protein